MRRSRSLFLLAALLVLPMVLPARALAGLRASLALAAISLNQHDSVGLLPFAEDLTVVQRPQAGKGTLLDHVVGHDPSAWAAGPVGPTDGILVVIGMYGGNDGLNTVVPFNDGHYYDMHGSLAIPGSQTLPIASGRGLNAELAEKELERARREEQARVARERFEDLLGFRRNLTQPTPLFREFHSKSLDGHPTPVTPFVRLSTGASGIGVGSSLGLAVGAADAYGDDAPWVHMIEGDDGLTPGRAAEIASAA